MRGLDFPFFLFFLVVHAFTIFTLSIFPVSESHDYILAPACALFTNLRLSSSSTSFTNPQGSRSGFITPLTTSLSSHGSYLLHLTLHPAYAAHLICKQIPPLVLALLQEVLVLEVTIVICRK